MLIAIELDYQEKLIKKGIEDDVLSSLDDIFKLCYRNRLFFKASLRFYSYLLQNYKRAFSLDARRFLTFVIEKYPIIMSETKNVDPLIILDENGHKDLSSFPAVCTVVDLPKDYTPSIYCENIDDAYFYIKIYESFEGSNNFYMKKDSFSGGNLATVAHRISNGDILFCVCDSDKKYLDDSLGSTADKMRDTFISNSHRYSDYYVLRVREIENLIPYSLLLSSDFTLEKETRKLVEILDKSNDEAVDFFDIKSGYDKRTRKKYSKNEKWLTVNKKVIGAMKRNHMYHSESGETKLIKGIGDNAIKRLNQLQFNKDSFASMKTDRQTEDIINLVTQIKRFGFVYRYSLT